MNKNDSSKTVHNESCERDPLFGAVAKQFFTEGDATTIRITFDYCIGYNRACRIVEKLEAAGILGPNRGRKPREVLVDLPTLEAILKKSNMAKKEK